MAAIVSQMQKQLQKQLQSKSVTKSWRQRTHTMIEEMDNGIELASRPLCENEQRQPMRSYHFSHSSASSERESSLSYVSDSGSPTLQKAEFLGFSFFTAERINPFLVSGNSLATLFLDEGKKKMKQGGFQIGGVILHSALLSGVKTVFPCNPFICIDRFDNSRMAKKITVKEKHGNNQ